MFVDAFVTTESISLNIRTAAMNIYRRGFYTFTLTCTASTGSKIHWPAHKRRVFYTLAMLIGRKNAGAPD